MIKYNSLKIRIRKSIPISLRKFVSYLKNCGSIQKRIWYSSLAWQQNKDHRLADYKNIDKAIDKEKN